MNSGSDTDYWKTQTSLTRVDNRRNRPMQELECTTCGFIYDEREGLPEEGFPPGTPWDQIPDDWVCPECGAGKRDFTPLVFD